MMIVQAEHVTTPKSPDPTPKQIRRECLEIQRSWSAKEKRKRAGGLVSPRWEVAEVVGVEDHETERRW